MRLNPYLIFNGQCEAAFRFYERCLHGKILMLMKYGESPLAAQTPAQWHQRVLHATFSLGDYILQGADSLPKTYQRPQGFSVMLNIDSASEAERIFNDLSVHGTVQIPLQESFWATLFGVLVDQFGTPWTINCGTPHSHN
jgi:PhnB protein